MEKKGTSVFSNGLIWFGAGVSLAEILTGTYFAPLGFGKAMAAILLGHLIGERTKKCHGNCENEFWRERKPSVCCLKCVTACRVDRNYDL